MSAEPAIERAGRARSPGRAIRARLLRGSGWVFAGMAFGSVLGVVVNALLARLLAPSQLGTYFLLFTLAAMCAQLANLGMEKAVVRTVSAGLGTDQPGRARAGIRLAFAFGGIGALVVASVMVLGLGGWLAENVYHSEVLAGAIVVGAGWAIALSLQKLVAETFRGYQRFAAATIFSGLAVDVLAVVVFGILWLRGAAPSLAQVVLIIVAVTSVVALAGSSLIWRRTRSLGREGTIGGRAMLAIGLPLVAVNALNFTVGTGIDLWIIAAFRPRTEVALYGAAFRLVFFVATAFIIASQVVPPIIAELHAQGRKRELEHSLREVATIAGIPAAIVLLAFLFFGGPIMGQVYGDFYREGATVLAILSVARLVAVATGNSGAMLMMTGHQRTMLAITAVSAVVGLTAELLVVRPFGMVGVAIATSCAQMLQAALQLIFGRLRVGIWTHAEFSLRPLKDLLGR